MTAPLRLLHLEPSAVDADRIVSTLIEGGFDCQVLRVDDPESYAKALRRKKYDLILSEYSCPGFEEFASLSLARKVCPDIPFLYVSTILGKDRAVDAVRRGAADYILKQRLGRLVPSVHRALRELEERAERKRVEQALRQSEKQLRQAQKLEAIGRLAGGLAHDFNNILTVIMGHSQTLLAEMPEQDARRLKVSEMQQAGDRAARLIRQLLTFSRPEPAKPDILSINQVIRNFETMMRRLLGEDLELTLELSQQDLHIKADHAQVEQVLMNLVVNARQSMPHGGRILIQTTTAQLKTAPMYSTRSFTSGTFVRLSVADTGNGMPPHVLSHIFEPFFTTKPNKAGTGLGLSTIYGIVTHNGGGIDVYSQVGEGSRFEVYFPCVTARRYAQETMEPPPCPSRGHETVLLVEDDQAVRELVRDGLTGLGYRVLESRNGLEACLIATQSLPSIQLVVTDVVMPGMSGTELAHHLRILKPDLRCLFMTGYLDDMGAHRPEIHNGYIQKPFTPELLGQRIRQLLGDIPSTRKTRQVPALSSSTL